MVISPERQKWEIWSRRFIRELGACETLAEWGELIAVNGGNLYYCEQRAPRSYAAVKAAIATEAERLDPCPANTSSASTAKATAESTPSTSKATDLASETE